MKLQDRLPRGVTVDGKFYRMDFDFRNVLRMIEILDDDDLMPDARDYNALHCICRHPKNVPQVLAEAKRTLFHAQRTQSEQKKLTDFVQDAELIRAAFRQTYGINLWTVKHLHWLDFIELLHGIPEGTRYSDTIGIRVREMPEPTKWNMKERQALAKAKAAVALHMNERDAAKQYDRDVQNIFHALLPLAKEVKPQCQTDASSSIS